MQYIIEISGCGWTKRVHAEWEREIKTEEDADEFLKEIGSTEIQVPLSALDHDPLGMRAISGKKSLPFRSMTGDWVLLTQLEVKIMAAGS